MGKGQTIIEGIVLEPQINYKYTPYYNHFFNGADTIFLVKNMSIIPQILWDKYFESESDQKNIDGNVYHHGEIWKAFKNVVPSLRGAWLIFPMEIRELLHKVKEFYVTYKTFAIWSIIINIHILINHLRYYLNNMEHLVCLLRTIFNQYMCYFINLTKFIVLCRVKIEMYLS